MPDLGKLKEIEKFQATVKENLWNLSCHDQAGNNQLSWREFNHWNCLFVFLFYWIIETISKILPEEKLARVGRNNRLMKAQPCVRCRSTLSIIVVDLADRTEVIMIKDNLNYGCSSELCKYITMPAVHAYQKLGFFTSSVSSCDIAFIGIWVWCLWTSRLSVKVIVKCNRPLEFFLFKLNVYPFGINMQHCNFGCSSRFWSMSWRQSQTVSYL